MSQSGFDAVFAAGRDALLAGTHRVEGDPDITGRWGPSLVLLPTGGVAEALDRLTTQIARVIGAGHWMSGGLGRAHLTVRALENEVLPNGRDPIWYCSLVHFARPVTAVADLLEWVEARRRVSLGVQVYDAAALCLWDFDGAAMRPLTVEMARAVT